LKKKGTTALFVGHISEQCFQTTVPQNIVRGSARN